jgi:hypothetical protein
LAAIVRAINLHEPLDDFIAASIQAYQESTIRQDELNPDQWQELQTLLEILQPFKKWTLILLQRSTPAQLANVVPAYDERLTHLEAQQVNLSSLEHTTPHLVAVITSVWTKLNK